MKNFLLSFVTTYETTKILQIKSKSIGFTYRGFQVILLLYIFGYAIIYEKGYQAKQEVAGVVTTKLKGLAYPTSTDNTLYKRVWDAADFIYPAQQESSFFVITNAVITPDQTPTTCPEDPNMMDVICDCDAGPCEGQCPPNTPVMFGNGIRTGNCVAHNSSLNVCEIYAWCPVEVDELPTEGILLKEVVNFTVLIKNTIEFQQFGFKKRNIFDDINDEDYLKGCMFNAKDPRDKFCPIFRLGDIIREASKSNNEEEAFERIGLDGGIIGIIIEWNCNLDLSESYCSPEYQFQRLDDQNAKLSPGFNFRYANFYMADNVQHRTLTKAYGIRFDIVVRGEAGKFDMIPLAINIGTGMALMAIATVICDIMVIYFHDNKEYFTQEKYHVVVDKDETASAEKEGDAIKASDDKSQTNYGSMNGEEN